MAQKARELSESNLFQSMYFPIFSNDQGLAKWSKLTVTRQTANTSQTNNDYLYYVCREVVHYFNIHYLKSSFYDTEYCILYFFPLH